MNFQRWSFHEFFREPHSFLHKFIKTSYYGWSRTRVELGYTYILKIDTCIFSLESISSSKIAVNIRIPTSHLELVPFGWRTAFTSCIERWWSHYPNALCIQYCITVTVRNKDIKLTATNLRGINLALSIYLRSFEGTIYSLSWRFVIKPSSYYF